MRTRLVYAALVLLPLGVSAEEAAKPRRSAILVVRHEEIKPGGMGDHDKQAASFQAVQRTIGADNNWIGFRPVAANDNSVMYFEPYESLAAMEKANHAVDAAVATNASVRAAMAEVNKHGDVHQSQRTMIFRYRDELSYRPVAYEDVARSRYLMVQWLKVKPGRGPDYVEFVKQGNAAREKAGVDAHFTTYVSMFGTEGGRYMTVSAIKDLASFDAWMAGSAEREKALDAALGGEAAARERRVRYSEIVDEAGWYLYAMDPKLSRPSETWIAYDPGFWTVTPAASSKAAASKKEK